MCLKIFFKYGKILVAEAHDRMYLNAALKQRFGNGVGNGASNAAANNGNLAKSIKMGGIAKRADKIGDAVANV